MSQSISLYLFYFLLMYPLVVTSSISRNVSDSPKKDCHHEHSTALLQFKHIFSINHSASAYCYDSHPKISSWKENMDCCSWDGVTCDEVTGHVIGLDLSCSELQGTIHSNNITTLFPLTHHLRQLNLAFNDFSLSPISSHFGRFASLTHLNLSSSNFSGYVPFEISHLIKLVSLDLSRNYYYDSFGVFVSLLELNTFSLKNVVQNLTQLMQLDLSRVNMSSVEVGTLRNLSSSTLTLLNLRDCGLRGLIPTSLSKLKQLTFLGLSDNNFSGLIPTWLCNLTQLSYLDLSSNNFNGMIPFSLSKLSQLDKLQLSYNHLTGLIPTWLCNLTQLSYLDLSSNNFSGMIPFSLSKLSQLDTLALSNNHLTGFIPPQLCNLTQLSYLGLYSNNFSGQIPYSLSKLKQLSLLGLSGNHLSGSIPSSLSKLEELGLLDLSNNHLSGSIPAWLGNLTRISDLFLGANKFSGRIPSSLGKLEQLWELDLSYNNLSGSIPSSLSKLEELTYLYLSNNHLSGIIPEEFGNLAKMSYLDLSSNNFSGEIPSSLLKLEQLEYLNLSINQFSGHFSFPGVEQLPWKNLLYLDLHSNIIQGPLPVPPLSTNYFLISNNKFSGKIPNSMCNASSLVVLDFSNNSLSGMLPQCLGNFSKSLSVLDLRKNYFNGTIPRTFGKGNSLRTLQFDGNQFEGPIPQSLTECKNLEVLDLGNNNINDTFPNWLDTLPNLQVLVLRSNRFHGPILTSKTRFPFPKLRIIDLSLNEFNGLLPEKYFNTLKAMMNAYEKNMTLEYMGERYYQDSVTVTLKGFDIELVKILTIYTTLDFSNNKFEGEIPKSIGKLTSLRLLNFSYNNLTSHIPLTLENLKNLESLDLSSNNLTGEIPEQLTSLTFLAFLNLSQNQLVGTIPRGKQFDTFANSSYEDNLGLCGFPLSKSCSNNDALQSPPLIQKEDNYEFCGGFGWKAILMGYGSGVVIGLAWGYHLLSARNPEWLMRIVERLGYKKFKRSNRNACRREKRRN